jgi:hypothetical protein
MAASSDPINHAMDQCANFLSTVSREELDILDKNLLCVPMPPPCYVNQNQRTLEQHRDHILLKIVWANEIRVHAQEKPSAIIALAQFERQVGPLSSFSCFSSGSCGDFLFRHAGSWPSSASRTHEKTNKRKAHLSFMLDAQVSWSSLILSPYWWLWLLLWFAFMALVLLVLLVFVDLKVPGGLAYAAVAMISPETHMAESRTKLAATKTAMSRRTFPPPTDDQSTFDVMSDAVAHLFAYRAWCESDTRRTWLDTAGTCTHSAEECTLQSNEDFSLIHRNAYGAVIPKTTEELQAQKPWLRFMQGGCYDVSWEKEVYNTCQRNLTQNTANHWGVFNLMSGVQSTHDMVYSPPVYDCSEGQVCLPGVATPDPETRSDVLQEQEDLLSVPTCLIPASYCGYVGMDYAEGPWRPVVNLDGTIHDNHAVPLGDCRVNIGQFIAEALLGVNMTRRLRTYGEQVAHSCSGKRRSHVVEDAPTGIKEALDCITSLSSIMGFVGDTMMGAVIPWVNDMSEKCDTWGHIDASSADRAIVGGIDSLMVCVGSIANVAGLGTAAMGLVKGLCALTDNPHAFCDLPADLSEWPRAFAMGGKRWILLWGSNPGLAAYQYYCFVLPGFKSLMTGFSYLLFGSGDITRVNPSAFGENFIKAGELMYLGTERIHGLVMNIMQRLWDADLTGNAAADAALKVCILTMMAIIVGKVSLVVLVGATLATVIVYLVNHNEEIASTMLHGASEVERYFDQLVDTSNWFRIRQQQHARWMQHRRVS